MTDDPKITISHLIPLYRSERFLEVITANITALAGPAAEIILADRNGDTAFCETLRRRLGALPNIRILCDHSNLNWVENIKGLIASARGRYLQILPHDDSTSKPAITALCRALDRAPDAVLAHGRVRAFDLDDNPLPNRDELNSREDPGATGWTLGDALPLFWTGRFAGAFKGVIRTAAAQHPNHVFRATPTTMLSERAWLFSLAIAGRFVFVDTDMLHKRYYPDSTHRAWKFTAETFEDIADLMVNTLRGALTDADLRTYAIRDVISNAAWRVHCLRHPGDGPFRYRPLAHPDRARIRQSILGWAHDTT